MTIRMTRRLVSFGAVSAGMLPYVRAAAEGLPPASRLPHITSTYEGVIIGCNTLTLGSAPLGTVIEEAVAAGYGILELHPRHVEPSFGPQGRPASDMTEQERAARQAGRLQLREWRLTVPLEEIAAIGTKCRAAGLEVFAFNENYRDDFTDAEIDRTFQMAQAMKCQAISAVGSPALFRRLDPFAKAYRLRVGLHNENDIHGIEQFESMRAGLSDYIGFTLDIGHFVSGGGDPMAMLTRNRDRIVNIHLSDGKRNGGPAMPFGEGDTPISQVLRYVRDTKLAAPLFVENVAPAADRLGLAKSSLEYCQRALASS